MPKPRIFVSSVIEDFDEMRQEARGAILEAGGEPILVNEDFPALGMSSRNACLDAVDSADIYLGIVGERGGWLAPSGKLVVEEEYERAKVRKLPTLIFLQEVSRDSEAERFARRMSDYVDGQFRKTFKTRSDLHSEIVKSLQALIPETPQPVTIPRVFENGFAIRHTGTGEASMRIIIAPERSEEVVDPVQLGSDEFSHMLLEIGHAREAGLFKYSKAKDCSVELDAIVIEEGGSGRGYSQAAEVRLRFTGEGALVADLNLTGRARNITDSLDSTVIAVEEIERSLQSIMVFYAAVMDRLDPYKRHTRFLYNGALVNLGYRTLERQPRPRTSHSISMRTSNEPILAFDNPRLIDRSDLQTPLTEIKRVSTLFERKASA